jgi:hypothetical protein
MSAVSPGNALRVRPVSPSFAFAVTFNEYRPSWQRSQSAARVPFLGLR